MSPKKRDDGDGSIFRRKDGKWVGQFTNGWTATGRRRYKTVTGRTRTEVKNKLKAAIAAGQDGLVTDNPYLHDWLDYWLKNIAKPNLEPGTWNAYRSQVNNINDTLGRVRLEDLRPEHIEKLHRNLNRAPATVLKAHRVLSRALKVAEQRGKISRNPATLVDAPTIRQHEVTPLTADDARSILRIAEGRRNAPRWTVALSLGLRQGEALGLRWDDIDLDAGTLTVRHALKRSIDGSGAVLGEPKTKKSKRTILMPRSLQQAMQLHRTHQAQERLRFGPDWTGDPRGDFVFTTPKGTAVSHQPDYAEWKKILNLAGVPSARLHDARHTAATLMMVQGVPARVVMEILGHSTIQLTMNTYSHVVPELSEAAAEAMDRALRG